MVFDKNTANEAREKSLDTRRSPALKKAWEEKREIKRLYFMGGMSGLKIAKLYKIQPRTAYRIINENRQSR